MAADPIIVHLDQRHSTHLDSQKVPMHQLGVDNLVVEAANGGHPEPQYAV
jgi:putative hemolysin